MHTNIVLDDSLVDEGQNLIYFGLRRAGQTERSTIDCCIAQVGAYSNPKMSLKDSEKSQLAFIRSKIDSKSECLAFCRRLAASLSLIA